MDINSLGAPSNSSLLANSEGSQELDKNAFLSLLVTQLKNQDPMEPMANEEFVAQLANFSTLEQMEELNENIVTMVYLQQGNALMDQLTQSSALIGQTVEWINPDTQMEFSGVVDSVKIENGLAVLRVEGQDVPLVDVSKVLGVLGPGTETDGEEDVADASGDVEEPSSEPSEA